MSATITASIRRWLSQLEPVLKAMRPEDLPGHVAADKSAPQWIADFMRVMKKTQDTTSIAALQAALARGDLKAAEAVIPWPAMTEALEAAWRPALISLLGAGATAAQGALPPPPSGAPDMSFRFDLTNPRAQDWVDAHAAENVKYVVDASKQAIRETVARAFAEGGHPYKQAQKIKQVIGLLPQHAQAVDTYRLKLIANGTSQAAADKLAEKYAAKLLKYRARNIARTETLTASNQGQLELWRQARDKGYLAAGALRRWLVADDERMCDECSALDGKTAGLDGSFPGGYDAPPAHPSCRCSQSIVTESNQ